MENRIFNLEKQLPKNEQYNCQNNVKISGVSNEIPDQDIEEKVIKICKDSDINISHMDIECCHRLSLRRNTTNTMKQVIVKLVNQKHSEAMLQWKQDINTKNKGFATHPLCPYYHYLLGKCKDLQRKGRISKVFCLGAVVTIKVTENKQSSNQDPSWKRPDGILCERYYCQLLFNYLIACALSLLLVCLLVNASSLSW